MFVLQGFIWLHQVTVFLPQSTFHPSTNVAVSSSDLKYSKRPTRGKTPMGPAGSLTSRSLLTPNNLTAGGEMFTSMKSRTVFGSEDQFLHLSQTTWMTWIKWS